MSLFFPLIFIYQPKISGFLIFTSELIIKKYWQVVFIYHKALIVNTLTVDRKNFRKINYCDLWNFNPRGSLQ